MVEERGGVEGAFCAASGLDRGAAMISGLTEVSLVGTKATLLEPPSAWSKFSANTLPGDVSVCAPSSTRRRFFAGEWEGDDEGEASDGELEPFGEDIRRNLLIGLEAFGGGVGTSVSEIVLAISPRKRALGSSGNVGISDAIDTTLTEVSVSEGEFSALGMDSRVLPNNGNEIAGPSYG